MIIFKKSMRVGLGVTAIAIMISFGANASAATVGQDETGNGYTNKSSHSNDPHNYYKHSGRGSYTSPFDYGGNTQEAPAPVIRKEPQTSMGKCNCFTFDGTKSYDQDKQKLTYTWDFGDGQTSDQAVTRHCYDKAGEYNAVLTVRDSSGEICGNGVANTKVYSNFPPTADAGAPVKACVSEEALFSASRSTASGPANFTWDFGDGQKGEGVQISHAYQKAGNYRVHLIVDDGKKTECSVASASTQAQITDKVTIKLTQTRNSICANKSIRFDANGTGNAKYRWDFGDGAVSEGGSSATHSYSKGGDYTVTVTADNGQDSSCSVATDKTTVRVYESPIANAGENLVCCIGRNTSFDGSKSTGSDLNYHWDFGDGTSAEGIKTEHAYVKPGNYRVVLTVKDASGSDCDQSSDSFVANANSQPEAVIEVR